ncbi:hypothetical protein SLEP1_g59170 [Rubroshorea leprosula]|uniref:Uncharacterized protein n=1 Tax=Rubroshorea leprosula TaxID=152421 RepID=A0AAV5MSN1_9ROSI|nr:hypothetical protein SLEP1_g59170 [Rubroshorea leprosula]
MRTIFSKSPLRARSTPPPLPDRQTFSESIMAEDIEVAQSIITKWDSSDSSSYCNIAYLFSLENRHEVKQYLNSIKHLQRYGVLRLRESSGRETSPGSEPDANHHKTVQREFYQVGGGGGGTGEQFFEGFTNIGGKVDMPANGSQDRGRMDSGGIVGNKLIFASLGTSPPLKFLPSTSSLI